RARGGWPAAAAREGNRRRGRRGVAKAGARDRHADDGEGGGRGGPGPVAREAEGGWRRVAAAGTRDGHGRHHAADDGGDAGGGRAAGGRRGGEGHGRRRRVAAAGTRDRHAGDAAAGRGRGGVERGGRSHPRRVVLEVAVVAVAGRVERHAAAGFTEAVVADWALAQDRRAVRAAGEVNLGGDFGAS